MDGIQGPWVGSMSRATGSSRRPYAVPSVGTNSGGCSLVPGSLPVQIRASSGKRLASNSSPCSEPWRQAGLDERPDGHDRLGQGISG